MNAQAQIDADISALYKKASYKLPRKRKRKMPDMTSLEKECYWRSLLDDPLCQKPESRQPSLPGFSLKEQREARPGPLRSP